MAAQKSIPMLETMRLILRPFEVEDGPEVGRLAGEWDVARMTKNIPYPYEDGLAEGWIAGHQRAFEEGTALALAVTTKGGNALVGAIGLMEFDRCASKACLGYWIGKPFWNRGYATEAAREMLRYAFEVADLNRVYASHFARNPASGRVMQKAGMKYEGTLRQHFRRWEEAEDVVMYGILRAQWPVGREDSLLIAGV